MQPFFPKITGPGRGQAPGPRDQISESEQGLEPPARPDVQSDIAGNPLYPIPQPPPKILDGSRQIVVAAGADGFQFNVPDDYDWCCFYFLTAPPATLSFGPNAPIWPVNSALLFKVPGTVRSYIFKNTAATPYTVYFLGTKGLDAPEIDDLNGGSTALPAVGQTTMANSLPVVIASNQSPISVLTESTRDTYSSGVAGLAPAAAATDIAEIIGSATRTVRVTRIQISGIATAAGAYNVQLIKRGAADTAGTSTTPTPVPLDATDAAAGAVVKYYTANPTINNTIGIVRSQRVTVTTAAGAIPVVAAIWDFGTRDSEPILLSGVAQTLALNLNGATMAGGALDIDIEWTEA